MWADIRSARSILWKVRHGHQMTYRERRVFMDILRFTRKLIIVAIPALELALLALPTRFQSEHMKRKKVLSARIRMDAFFEDAVGAFVKETKRKQHLRASSEDIPTIWRWIMRRTRC